MLCDQNHLFSQDSGNPLLSSLLPEKTFIEWADALVYDPLSGSNARNLNIAESHLRLIEQVFVPTKRAIVLAMSLSSMLISSLRRRDPRLPKNRKYQNELANFAEVVNKDNFEKMPWIGEGASGAVVLGPTGCSKTHSCDAFLRLMPQVIEHGPNLECGWKYLRQMVYLRVPMPTDASRKGLLINIIWQLDVALGTSYLDEVTGRLTQEQLVVEVLKLLTVYKCGMLILEEVQERNIAPRVLGSEFSNVFLKILNAGIPLVLVGNPMSFAHIMAFSQDRRRFTNGGLFEFIPALSFQEDEWCLDLVPGIWGWTLLRGSDQIVEDLPKLLFERTGGIPGVLSTYRHECLVEAHRAQADRVTMAHINAAYWSPSMVGMHDLVDAYKNKDLAALAAKFTDQPVAFLNDVWERERRFKWSTKSKDGDASAASAG